MIDPDTVERVDRLSPVAWSGVAGRHLAPGRNPISGEGARVPGGRWNPPDSFPALYLALDVDTVAAEFYRLAARQALPPEGLLPRELYRFEMTLAAVLDLRDAEVREQVGLDERELGGDDLRPCQGIGAAAHHLGREGVLAPSAAGSGAVLVVFRDRLGAGSDVRPLDHRVWRSLPAPPQR